MESQRISGVESLSFVESSVPSRHDHRFILAHQRAAVEVAADFLRADCNGPGVRASLALPDPDDQFPDYYCIRTSSSGRIRLGGFYVCRPFWHVFCMS
jgi:hypothetical protein